MRGRTLNGRFWFGCLLLGWLLGATVCASAALRTLKLHGESCHDVAEIGRSLGMTAKWIEPKKTLRLESRWSQIDFSRNERHCTLNGVKVHLGRSIVEARGSLWITELDFERTLQPIITPQVFSRKPGKLKRIMIDPGHGGKDPGTINKALNLQEKSLVLDLSKRVEKLLKAEGYEVIFTRRDDRFIDLSHRTVISNSAKVDLFLSLHFNAAGSAQVEGVETFAFTPRHQPSTARSHVSASDRRVYKGNEFDVWNTLLGYEVQRQLTGLPRAKDRGLKRARWDVLRELACPGILIESGFVTHAREGRDIGSAGYRQQIAEAIVAGVKAYEERLAKIR